LRVLVFGGRAYNNREKVYYTLDDYHAKTPITLVIHGSCRSRIDLSTQAIIWSADELAEQWAKDNYIPYLGIPAVWRTKHGGKIDKSAGPTRNALMIAKGKPQAGIGFPGENGTADMASKLKAAGIPTILVDP
jgi:hypothetical protein